MSASGGLNMKVVPYTEQYRDDVRRICIDTASPDNKVNPEHHDFTLLMYCDPYIDHETVYVLLDDEDKPRGYIMCAEDYEKFAEDVQPYLEKIRKECPNFASRADITMYEARKDEYPAHLHIDIEESYTGNGHGTALMKTLVAHLKEKHVRGVMLGVDKHNRRAVSFYTKMGFRVMSETEGGAEMGMKL